MKKLALLFAMVFIVNTSVQANNVDSVTICDPIINSNVENFDINEVKIDREFFNDKVTKEEYEKALAISKKRFSNFYTLVSIEKKNETISWSIIILKDKTTKVYVTKKVPIKYLNTPKKIIFTETKGY